MQEISLEGYLTLQWRDTRVNLSSVILDTGEFALLDLETALKQIWLPDIWIESLRSFEIHRSVKDQAILQLNGKNEFYFWQRYPQN